MKYFTSDTHINHTKVLGFQQRPFLTLQENDNTIVDNICSIVKPDDELYFLSDVIMGQDLEYGLSLLRKIPCKKFLIEGNHDKKRERYGNVFEKITKYMEVNDEDEEVIFCLSHYPFLYWHHQRGGSIMLHGHIHSQSSYNEINRRLGIKRYDVGVDANNYKPVSSHEIVEFFKYVKNPDMTETCPNEVVRQSKIFIEE